MWSRSWSRPLHPADRPEVAPGRAAVSLRVVAHIAGPDALCETACMCPRRFDLRPERVVVEVVAVAEAGQVLAGGRPQHPPLHPPAGECPVDPADGLDA